MNKKIFKIFFVCVLLMFISPVFAEEFYEDSINEEYIENIDSENYEILNGEYIENDIKQIKSYTNHSTNYTATVDDSADLLSEMEEEKLLEQLKSLTEFGNAVFKSTDVNNYNSVKLYADNYYYDNYGISSGTILLIDMYTRELFIYSNGKNYNIIDDKKGYSITDNVYRYASKSEYYECAKEAFNEIEKLLNGYKINEPMRIICNAIISVVLASFIGFFIVYFKYKLKKTNSYEMLKHSKSSFVVNNIDARKTGTHKVYNPRTDSSSGGGYSSGGGHSFSGGGGGGHGGGGGGHRF